MKTFWRLIVFYTLRGIEEDEKHSEFFVSKAIQIEDLKEIRFSLVSSFKNHEVEECMVGHSEVENTVYILIFINSIMNHLCEISWESLGSFMKQIYLKSQKYQQVFGIFSKFLAEVWKRK